MTAESVRWKGRDAIRLWNQQIELVVLPGGGHLASFRYLDQTGNSSENVLWEAPWPTLDPELGLSNDLSPAYGPVELRKFLNGFTGHALCLDYYGAPSAAQAAAGLSLHGEAALQRWKTNTAPRSEGNCWSATAWLPHAQLRVDREICLAAKEVAVFVRETVTNENAQEHAFDWVQHVTFGTPFLQPGESTFSASAARGIVSPLPYDEGSMLASDRQFVWPNAPSASGDGVVDLRLPFSREGGGLIASVQLNPHRESAYLLAINWKSRLGVGYCFRRADFPWMAIWEENRARTDAPWNKTTQARGMEFGTTPLPLGREENERRGPLFGTPHQCVIPGNGQRTAVYLMFLFNLPPGVEAIENLEVASDSLTLYDQQNEPALSVPAHGCGSFLAPG